MRARNIIFAIVLLITPANVHAAPPEQKIVYGHSVHGRPLIAYILGDGPNVTLVSGGVHGNETSSPGLVSKLREYLIAHPEELNGYTVALVVNVNPDGDAAHTRANAHGVDLNRNFPDEWAPKRPGVKLSTGTGPLSEPESAGLAALIDRIKPQKAVSVHQPFHMLVAGQPLGTPLANAMQAENHYRISDTVGYPTPGSFGTFLSKRNIAAVTLELPWESVSKAWDENRSALLAAIRFTPPPAPAPPAIPEPAG
jgi:protein MpaA